MRVEEGKRRADIGWGEVVERCFPAWSRRMVGVGRVVRRESRWQSVGRVVSLGMVRGMAGREVSWMVEEGRGEEVAYCLRRGV